MKRYSVYSGLSIAVLTIVACGGGSAPPAEQAVAPGAAGAPSDAAATGHAIGLYVRARAAQGDSVAADCVARAGAKQLVVIRGEQVQWRVRNATGSQRCEGLPTAQLELVFENPVLVGANDAPTNRVSANAGNALVIATINGQATSRGLQKYVVCYNKAQASEDPWLDIYGDDDQPIRPEGDLPATTTLPSC